MAETLVSTQDLRGVTSAEEFKQKIEYVASWQGVEIGRIALHGSRQPVETITPSQHKWLDEGVVYTYPAGVRAVGLDHGVTPVAEELGHQVNIPFWWVYGNPEGGVSIGMKQRYWQNIQDAAPEANLALIELQSGDHFQQNLPEGWPKPLPEGAVLLPEVNLQREVRAIANFTVGVQTLKVLAAAHPNRFVPLG